MRCTNSKQQRNDDKNEKEKKILDQNEKKLNETHYQTLCAVCTNTIWCVWPRHRYWLDYNFKIVLCFGSSVYAFFSFSIIFRYSMQNRFLMNSKRAWLLFFFSLNSASRIHEEVLVRSFSFRNSRQRKKNSLNIWFVLLSR